MAVLEQYVQATIEANGSAGLADFSLPVADWTIANSGDGTISVTPIVFPASMQVGVEQYYFTQPSATLEQLIAESGATLVFTNGRFSSRTRTMQISRDFIRRRLIDHQMHVACPLGKRSSPTISRSLRKQVEFIRHSPRPMTVLISQSRADLCNRQNFKPNTAIWTTLTSLPSSHLNLFIFTPYPT